MIEANKGEHPSICPNQKNQNTHRKGDHNGHNKKMSKFFLFTHRATQSSRNATC